MIRSKFSMIGVALAAAMISASALAAPNPPAAGYPPNSDIGAVLTNTIQAAGTRTAAPTTVNTQWKGVTCASLWTASSGSPTSVFSIEGYDAATAAYYQIATTGTISTNNGLPNTLTVYPGVAVSSLSSGNVAQSAHLPRVWRLKEVIAGSGGPRLTSKIGCNYLN
jgi:hypothetical protein